MKYWRGIMNWPKDQGWVCEVCSQNSLIWGMVHGTCRCTYCHVHYRMRDAKDKVVTTPICQLKAEYYEATKRGWKELGTPMDGWTDEQWSEVGAPINN